MSDYTELLLHMNGDNDGTVITDSSPNIRTVDRYNVVTKTGQKKFGTASGYFNGTNAYLEVDNVADMNMGTGDFTWDMWIRLDNLTGWKGIYGWSLASNDDWGGIWTNGDDLNFHWRTSDTYRIACYKYNILTAGVWTHIALVRYGATLKWYVNGTDVGASTGYDINYNISSSYNWRIGRRQGLASSKWFAGYIDELRITKGLARWTENFTPPTIEYLSSEISGILTEEARVIIVGNDTGDIEHDETHIAGHYEIPILSSPTEEKIVTAVPTDSAKRPLTHGGVLPKLLS